MSLMFTDSLILIGLLSVAGAVVWGVKQLCWAITKAGNNINGNINNVRLEIRSTNHYLCESVERAADKIADTLTPPVQSLPEDYSPLPPMYLNEGETLEHLAGVVDGTEGSVLGAVGLHL